MKHRRVRILVDNPWGIPFFKGDIVRLHDPHWERKLGDTVCVNHPENSSQWMITIDNRWAELIYEEVIEPPKIPEVVISQGIIK